MTSATRIARKLRPELGAPGKSTMRACTVREILCAVLASRTAKKRVRVYSSEGFVPNSYRYGCKIQYIEGTRDAETGVWTFRTGWGHAQRPYAKGSLLIVQ